MTTLQLDRPSLFDGLPAAPPRRRPSHDERRGAGAGAVVTVAATLQRARSDALAGQTLDTVVTGLLSGLSSHQTVACPVCSGPMAPRYGAGPGPAGGRCTDCGTTLG